MDPIRIAQGPADVIAADRHPRLRAMIAERLSQHGVTDPVVADEVAGDVAKAMGRGSSQ